jgi:hypothetical protein
VTSGLEALPRRLTLERTPKAAPFPSAGAVWLARAKARVSDPPAKRPSRTRTARSCKGVRTRARGRQRAAPARRVPRRRRRAGRREERCPRSEAEIPVPTAAREMIVPE